MKNQLNATVCKQTIYGMDKLLVVTLPCAVNYSIKLYSRLQITEIVFNRLQ
jgi:hypothetical protein